MSLSEFFFPSPLAEPFPNTVEKVEKEVIIPPTAPGNVEEKPNKELTFDESFGYLAGAFIVYILVSYLLASCGK